MRAGFEKTFCKERFVRNGKLQMNLLRPAVEQFVRRWGYYDKETTCKVFENIVQLFKEDLKNDTKAKASVVTSKSVLPKKEGDVVAKAAPEKLADAK